MESRPLRRIPLTIGSIPAPEHIIGRDELVGKVVKLLDAGNSVLLTGDRRVGKTSIARLVERELAKAKRLYIRTSAERASYGEFVSELARLFRTTPFPAAVREEVGKWTVGLNLGVLALQRAGKERGLEELIEVVVPPEGQPPLVLIIDEVPVLAKKMEEAQPGSGTEFLSLLRRVRQQYPQRLSMLLLGSIGFHHVGAAAPGAVNDLTTVAVGSVDEADAIYLAQCLMKGEGVSPADPIGVALAVAQAAETVPYYVQHLVKACLNAPGQGAHLEPSDVDMLAQASVADPDDPWSMAHYRERISQYYGAERAELVETILDLYATEQPLTIDNLMLLLGASGLADLPSRKAVVRVVETLERDHYLRRDGDHDVFRSELVRRYWKRALR